MQDKHTRIILMRHGDDKANAKQQFSDEELTIEGVSKVQQTLLKLQTLGITRIYSSSSLRSSQTAQIVSESIDIPYIMDERIDPRNLGVAAGLTYREVEQRFSELLSESTFHMDFRFPDGESNGDVFERNGLFLRDLLLQVSGIRESVLIISSPLVLNYILFSLQDLGFREGMLYIFECAQYAVLESQDNYYQLIEFSNQ